YEMLTNMKAKLDASRSMLYETSRFVDIYKTYDHISSERSLTKEEREEMKRYQKLADFYTPLLKGMTSEFCNQLAYDAIQIHGGSGFMKDYPVERIYRDARITTIYEGTTQLQVVAAIRGVTTGGYLAHIREYEKVTLKPELESFRRVLISLTQDYEEAVNKVVDSHDNEFIDFHARRLVEMAGYLVFSYLLVLDSNRDMSYLRSTRAFIQMAKGEIKSRYESIRSSNLSDLGDYKYEL
ncbi:MAG: Acyl-CoA dehydrogenase C-terminal domain-containing protein, partial [Bacteroidota bacterium]|nr:Acyl-CoA dehydrogenase C-terminal domain-containing protein [Bacteroidota bacterium]